jgi:hypothetical protein
MLHGDNASQIIIDETSPQNSFSNPIPFRESAARS